MLTNTHVYVKLTDSLTRKASFVSVILLTLCRIAQKHYIGAFRFGLHLERRVSKLLCETFLKICVKRTFEDLKDRKDLINKNFEVNN